MKLFSLPRIRVTRSALMNFEWSGSHGLCGSILSAICPKNNSFKVMFGDLFTSGLFRNSQDVDPGVERPLGWVTNRIAAVQRYYTVLTFETELLVACRPQRSCRLSWLRSYVSFRRSPKQVVTRLHIYTCHGASIVKKCH